MAVSSAGMMTIGTRKDDSSSMNVGTAFLSLSWKVYLSGAVIEATSSSIFRSTPTFW